MVIRGMVDMVDTIMARERPNQNQDTMDITIMVIRGMVDMVDTIMARERPNQNQDTMDITIMATRDTAMEAIVTMDKLRFQQFRQSVEFSRNESKYFVFLRK